MENSIAKYIQRYVKLKIQSEHWKPNQKLPSENQLAQRFDCSRLTARAALLPLVYSGVLIAKKGKGYVVSKNSEDLTIRSITQKYKIKKTKTEQIIDLPKEFESILNLSNEKILAFKKTYSNDDGVIAVQYTALNKEAFWRKDMSEFDESITVALAKQGVLITKTNLNVSFKELEMFKCDTKELGWKDNEKFLVEKVEAISEDIWVERTLRVYNKDKYEINFVKFRI